MTLGAAPSAWLLLVQPLQSLWFDPQGQPSPEAPPARHTVRVVADLIEETHVTIAVPALMGSERQGLIQVQLNSQLPDMPLRTTWQTAASQPLLPKAFALQAMGVASPALQSALDAELEVQRPLQGVWSLSYLMAHWVQRRKGLSTAGWLFLCLSVPYGLRMVLLDNGVPVFSRLLLDTDPAQQATEVGLTLKYLADNRVLARFAQVGLVLLQPAAGLAEALEAQGHTVVLRHGGNTDGGVLAEVLALAGPRAPGQLASNTQRRYFLARQARQGLTWGGGLLVLGGLVAVAVQGQAVMARLNQTQQAQQLAIGMEAEAQRIQQAIVASGVDTSLMRVAIEVKERELSASIRPTEPLWLLGQLMQGQPQAELQRTELSLVANPCGGATAGGPAAPRPTSPSGTTQATAQEWSFEIRADERLSPRTRLALLEHIGQTVRTWPAWQVLVDPVQAESGAVIASAPDGTGAASAWRWCLAPAAPPQGETAPGGGT